MRARAARRGARNVPPPDPTRQGLAGNRPAGLPRMARSAYSDVSRAVGRPVWLPAPLGSGHGTGRGQ
ncbi:hypothetical protein HMPREF0063_10475 [Aeromicrobium marinum DSM 15272]|uniref:Uncharacterized protein n=1 Tax=Aeromicrobium marinum DSM 15272 TaxID=585531 RepID=E2S8W7_9ACTN|nr:hypothetical protein HMPREF0063_10475 [Aeromicrobium marinum DSM 15272]